jgi:hypothetical protein
LTWRTGCCPRPPPPSRRRRVGHEITVVIVKSAAISRRELLSFGTVPSADGDEGGVRQVLYDVAGVARPVLAEADATDVQTEILEMNNNIPRNEKPVVTELGMPARTAYFTGRCR